MQPQMPIKTQAQAFRDIAQRRLPLTDQLLSIDRYAERWENRLSRHPDPAVKELVSALRGERATAMQAARDLKQLDSFRLNPAGGGPGMLAQHAAEQQNVRSVQTYLHHGDQVLQAYGDANLRRTGGLAVAQMRRGFDELATEATWQEKRPNLVGMYQGLLANMQAQQQAKRAADEFAARSAGVDPVLLDVNRQRIEMAPERLERIQQVEDLGNLATETAEIMRSSWGQGALDAGWVEPGLEWTALQAEQDAGTLVAMHAGASAALSSLRELDEMTTMRVTPDSDRMLDIRQQENDHQNTVTTYLGKLQEFRMLYFGDGAAQIKEVENRFTATAGRFTDLTARENAALRAQGLPAQQAVTANAATAPLVPGAPSAGNRAQQPDQRAQQAGRPGPSTGQQWTPIAPAGRPAARR
jgi:hypothetical protein